MSARDPGIGLGQEAAAAAGPCEVSKWTPPSAFMIIGEVLGLMLQRTQTDGKVRGATVDGLAIADQLTGPYRLWDEPLTASGVTIADGSAFPWDGKICLLPTSSSR